MSSLAKSPRLTHDTTRLSKQCCVLGGHHLHGEGKLKIAHSSQTRSRRLAFSISARRGLRLALVLAAVGALASLTVSGAANAGGNAPVSQGIGAAVLPSTAFGDTPADTAEVVSFVLRARDLGGLEAQVQAGMPGGFLSVSDFARRYGQPQQTIAALEGYLAHFGISSQAMADGLVVQASGNAGAFDAALSVQQKEYHVPSTPRHDGRPGRPGMDVHGTKQSPLLPRDLARSVLAILGLSNYPTMQSNMIGVAQGAEPQQAKPNLAPNTQLLPADFAARYDLNPVYGSGGTGAGRTIGIVTLASVDPSVVSVFWNFAGLTGSQASASRITLTNVDGGAGPVNEAYGSDESTLDAEQSGALAPDANVLVYQAPNTDYGYADAFFQAASDNTADSVSASWGESETLIKYLANGGLEDPNYVQAYDEAFLELAAQGQSAFAASGDSGAYDASSGLDLGATDLAVDNPSDSPWITSAGGTTLPGTLTTSCCGSVTIPSERAWGWDYLWPALAQGLGGTEEDWAKTYPVGGGGGYSAVEPMPQYQRGVPGTGDFSAVQYLTPIAPVQANGLTLSTDWSFDPSPPTTQGRGNGRATPDVSTDADPETGYLVVYTFGDSTDPNAPPSLAQYGGTSFVAPQLNGATAAIDSALGRRVGFWNPLIYRFATMGNGSPFTPLDTPGTSNDNLYYSGTPGHVFNVGTGLGTPDLAKLALDFASTGPVPGHGPGEGFGSGHGHDPGRGSGH